MPIAISGRMLGAAGLGLAALLGACAPETGFQDAQWSPPIIARLPATAAGPAQTGDSLTLQRVRGVQPEFDAVMPEEGNVWPAQEAQRATLMSGPDEAMRNIPDYRPSLVPGTGEPVRSPVPTPGVPGSGSPGGLGTQGLPPPPPLTPTPAPRVSGTGGVGLPPEGRVLTSPSGRPAVTTGQAGSVSGVTSPSGGGAVIRDGNVETWIGPDGRARTRVVPLGQ
ncbi:hypothetical protein [Falsiroseomonas sp. HW251]|uniref:hypothetical protein n=1 Tax=Falsiroseomonas sp. HW251 TaxID=3390998 RepID=UPI003D31CC7C